MAVSLQKGQKVSITKDNPGLSNVVVGLGWDVNRFDTGGGFDLDTAAFMLGDNGKCPTDNEFIFFGNLKHSTGCVEHLGDNRTGVGDGDDEQIKINLNAIPANISRIAFSVTIYDADARRQNFGQVNNAYIRIYNELTGVWSKDYKPHRPIAIMINNIIDAILKNGPNGIILSFFVINKIKAIGKARNVAKNMLHTAISYPITNPIKNINLISPPPSDSCLNIASPNFFIKNNVRNAPAPQSIFNEAS